MYQGWLLLPGFLPKQGTRATRIKTHTKHVVQVVARGVEIKHLTHPHADLFVMKTLDPGVEAKLLFLLWIPLVFLSC